jgi:DNA polymerase-4
VGNGMTFPRNLEGEEEIRAGVQYLCQRVAARLRKKGFKCTTLQVTIRSPELKQVSRQRKLTSPTYSSRELTRLSLGLMGEIWRWDSPVRAITITGAGLLPEDQAGVQMDLFAPGESRRREKEETLERTMDKLRAKYGPSVVGFASDRTQTARGITGVETKEEERE